MPEREIAGVFQRHVGETLILGSSTLTPQDKRYLEMLPAIVLIRDHGCYSRYHLPLKGQAG